jgi:hypothetical protein
MASAIEVVVSVLDAIRAAETDPHRAALLDVVVQLRDLAERSKLAGEPVPLDELGALIANLVKSDRDPVIRAREVLMRRARDARWEGRTAAEWETRRDTREIAVAAGLEGVLSSMSAIVWKPTAR